MRFSIASFSGSVSTLFSISFVPYSRFLRIASMLLAAYLCVGNFAWAKGNHPNTLEQFSANIGAPIHHVRSTTTKLSISDTVWFEDTENNTTINDILTSPSHKWASSGGKDLDFGRSNSRHWIVMRMRFESNTSPEQSMPEKSNWILDLSYPQIHVAALYYYDDDTQSMKRVDHGVLSAMGQRDIRHRGLLYPINLPSGQAKTFILEVERKASFLQVPLTLWSAPAFLESNSDMTYLYGMLFGAMIAMMVYNSILAFSIRHKAYIIYVLYIGFTLLGYLSLSGFGFLYLWPNNPEFNIVAIPIFCSLSVVFIMIFTRELLNLKTHMPSANTMLTALIMIGIAIPFLAIVTKNTQTLWLTTYTSLTCIITFFISIAMWRKGNRQAGLFVIAWTPWIIGMLTYLAALYGFFPDNIFTRNSIFMGSVIEIVLLAFIMSDQINIDRKEKYRALKIQNESIGKLQQVESELIHRSLHSRTTGLPNRSYLRNTLDELVTQDSDIEYSLFLISLNNFHTFNKTLGHSNGDSILKKVTDRLNDTINQLPDVIAIEQDIQHRHCIATVEGVTFGFSAKTAEESRANEIANLVLEALERPFLYNGLTLDVEAAIGISLWPRDADTTDKLLKNAQIALEDASNNNQRIAFYSFDIDPYNAKRLSLLAELKLAIEFNALELYFQPQINLRDDSLAGVEVLLRWNHEKHGFIPPDEFIPLAERTGVIQALTYWVCQKAFSTMVELQQQGIDIPMSINISTRNLMDRSFKNNVLALAQNCGVKLENIMLELTETSMMTNPDEALATLNDISATGMKISIDDFGTGYSSLSYLKKLPVQELKIDRAFVMDMANNPDDQVIVETTVKMAHSLGLSVVAEGVEDLASVALLKTIGCNYAQGYHFARPMNARKLTEWFHEFNSAPPSASASA